MWRKILNEFDKSFQTRGKSVWAQGYPGTNSKRSTQYPSNAPQFLSKAQGPYVWDLNNRRYIDFVSSLGAIILGHNHPKVHEAVSAQLNTGYVSGTFPHPIEIETAEIIQDMFPACERIRFLKNGDDATRAAIRIARTTSFLNTKRSLVISEGYHGSSDLWTSLTPPAYGVKDMFHIAKYESDMELKNTIFITEPVLLDTSDERKLFLKKAKKDSIVIYDEIITGCRVPQYSVHRWWDLKPDIVCLGKAIANGFPLSVVGGKKEIMDAKEYFISTTFSGEAVSIAACKATLLELKKKNMNDLCFYANRFQEKFNELCKGIGVSISGYGTRGSMDLTDPKVALFCQEAIKGGIIFGKAFFYHFGHYESGIEDYVFNILSDIVRKIELGKVKYEGELPVRPFVR